MLPTVQSLAANVRVSENIDTFRYMICSLQPPKLLSNNSKNYDGVCGTEYLYHRLVSLKAEGLRRA